ncbi:MAG TPA: hydrogenase maturation nickel metallochaperone HypA [Acetobacteraceae bacterium]|jgi:hydrogenase nickel incorporation protein HypA/HybF
MHELALSQSIVDLVAESAAREGVRKVTKVVLEIGAAAAVEPQALLFCFGVVAEQTAMQGAELVINTVALQAKCRHCGREYSPAALFDPCPGCGSHDRDLLRGRELRVTSFDAE